MMKKKKPGGSKQTAKYYIKGEYGENKGRKIENAKGKEKDA